MGNVKFLFKDDAYEFRELFSMHLTGKNLFKSGEVINSTTGESFDISEICDIKNRYRHLLEDSVNNIGNMHDKRIRWAIENEEKEKRYLELKNLYEKKNIEIDEMFEYLKLKKDIDKTFIKGREMFSMNYEKFITLNIGERLPDGLCKADKGRFYDMLFFLSYDNKLKQSSRKNGRIIKKEDLMVELELSNYNSYRKFMSKLSSLNIIREVPTTNKTKVIILNPIYVNRNIRIDYTTYIIFKNDIKKFLSEEEIFYIELLGNRDDLIDAHEIE